MSLRKFLITFVGSLLTALALFYFYYRKELSESPTFHLKTLAFTTVGKESIPKDFFEEVLDLNPTDPINLLQFSSQQARNKLLEFPFIEEASLETLLPDTLLIECKLRTPCFELADFENLCVDKEGVIFPTTYFYTPKKLPKVFLGLGQKPIQLNGHTLKLDELELNLILSLIKQTPDVKLIDLVHLNADSLGEQEIILTFANPKKRYVRLPVNGWQKALTKLEKIPPNYHEVDLRYANMALVR